MLFVHLKIMIFTCTGVRKGLRAPLRFSPPTVQPMTKMRTFGDWSMAQPNDQDDDHTNFGMPPPPQVDQLEFSTKWTFIAFSHLVQPVSDL